jgi:hypothetical protein
MEQFGLIIDSVYAIAFGISMIKGVDGIILLLNTAAKKIINIM